MKEASSNPTIKLKTDEYELDDLSELMDLRAKEGTESVSQLHIHMLEPDLSVSIEREVHLTASDDTPTVRGVLENVKDLMKSRMRLLSFSFLGETSLTSTILAFTPVLLGVGCFALIVSYPLLMVPLAWAGSPLLIVGLILIWKATRTGSIIVLRRRIEAGSFLKRRSDEILLVIVTAILTFILTLLGTWITGWFPKH